MHRLIETEISELRDFLDGWPRELRVGEQIGSLETMSDHSGIEGRMANLAEQFERAVIMLENLLKGQQARSDLLAREADHRIKNSLQLVMSLLRRQADRAQSVVAQRELQAAGSRMLAVTEVHKMLHSDSYQAGASDLVGLSTYLQSLCAALGEAFGADDTFRSLRVTVEPVQLPVASVQSIGMLVSELVTNAFRHAFGAEATGSILVTGHQDGSGYLVCVEDDGCGPSPDFDLKKRGAGLGLNLVKSIAHQLNGSLAIHGPPGTKIALSLPGSGCRFR